MRIWRSAATVSRGVADHLELVLESSDGSQTSLPMFSESGGTWRAVLSNLTERTLYFVRCYRARSEKYAIRIITVPRIETVRVQVVPPEYADQPSYEGHVFVPGRGRQGSMRRNPKVTLWATSKSAAFRRQTDRCSSVMRRTARETNIPCSPSETRQPGGRWPLRNRGQREI